MDENNQISRLDLNKFKNSKIVNSIELYPKGTPDEILTRRARREGWVIVTKDVRMAFRSLVDGVPVVFISDEFKMFGMLKSKSYGKSEYAEMFDYIKKRKGYVTTSEIAY